MQFTFLTELARERLTVLLLRSVRTVSVAGPGRTAPMISALIETSKNFRRVWAYEHMPKFLDQLRLAIGEVHGGSPLEHRNPRAFTIRNFVRTNA